MYYYKRESNICKYMKYIGEWNNKYGEPVHYFGYVYNNEPKIETESTEYEVDDFICHNKYIEITQKRFKAELTNLNVSLENFPTIIDLTLHF